MSTKSRANFLPSPEYASRVSVLRAHLARVTTAISPDNFVSICDPTFFEMLRNAFESVKADEGSVWLADAERRHLVVTYNTGPNADQIVGFRQPLGIGLISLVFALEQGLAEKDVHKHARHSPLLDQKVGKTTYAMIAVPFYFLNQIRGVISCVQFVQVRSDHAELVPVLDDWPSGFGSEELAKIQSAAGIVRTLVEFRLLATAVGWSQH